MKRFLPIFWFIFTAFNIYAGTSLYEQKYAINNSPKKIFLKQTTSQNESNNQTQFCDLTEEVEENIGDNLENDSPILLLDSLDFIKNLFLSTKTLVVFNQCVKSALFLPNFYNKATFIRFCCLLL